jgi:antitoxin HigA-1
MRIPKRRTPTHPGEMLRAEFLEPMNVSQTELARAIHVPFQRINELINGRRGITPGTALRLARHLGTTPGFWMNLQQRWDLFHASLDEAATLRKISRR